MQLNDYNLYTKRLSAIFVILGDCKEWRNGTWVADSLDTSQQPINPIVSAIMQWIYSIYIELYGLVSFYNLTNYIPPEKGNAEPKEK